MRFERKYRIENLSLAEVRHLLHVHVASFSTLYPDRQINNIYFDSPDLLTYRLNTAGVGYRKKYRVRWYGDDPRQVSNPQFEIKIKKNELGEKQIFPVDSFSLTHLQPLTQQINQLAKGGNLLLPVLLNSYKRSYLISRDGRFRVTIDHHMHYHGLLRQAHFLRYTLGDPAIILEMKYEAEDDESLHAITQNLPFRQSKHSKYVVGVELTN